MAPLIENQKWENYFDKPDCVIHCTKNSVYLNENYQKFVSKFQKKCHHLVINKDVCQNRIIFNDSGELQCKLNMVNENIFPISSFDTKSFKSSDFSVGDPLQLFKLAPKNFIGLDLTTVLKEYKPLEIKENVKKSNLELIKEIEVYKLIKKSTYDLTNEHEAILSTIPKGEVEIIFLGTGCAIPSKYRNGNH
jgi:hypothetical protein